MKTIQITDDAHKALKVHLAEKGGNLGRTASEYIEHCTSKNRRTVK